MAITKGVEGQEGNQGTDQPASKENEAAGPSPLKSVTSEKNEPTIVEMMAKQLLLMQDELKAMKEHVQTQAGASGVSAEQFSQLIKAIKEKPEADLFDSEMYIREEDIDPLDYNKEGVNFFCNATGYVIGDDIRKGKAIRTPYKNMIVFRYQGTRITKVGKYQETATFSSYTSHSNKEIQWIRDHRFYGAIFWESATDALETDIKKSQRIMKFMSALNTMDQHQIIARCHEQSVAVSSDLKVMRYMLADKLAEDEARRELDAAGKRAVSALEEAVFVQEN